MHQAPLTAVVRPLRYSFEVDSTTVSLLNQLIATTLDGERGFRAAANEISDPLIRSVLDDCAVRCRDSIKELEKHVRDLNAKPALNGSAIGVLHRAWLEATSRFTGHNTVTILRECERGELHAKSRYEDVLKQRLPEDIREVVKRQYQGIVANQQVLQEHRSASAIPRPRVATGNK